MEDIEMKSEDVRYFLALFEREERISNEKQKLIDFLKDDFQDITGKLKKANEKKK